MPRDENSVFAWGIPTYREAVDSFKGTKPAFKIVNSENEVTKKQDPPKEKKTIKPRKKKGVEVKNYILSLLTKSEE
jgi:hypothetical protein